MSHDDPYYADDGDPADGEEPPAKWCLQCGDPLEAGKSALCDDCYWFAFVADEDEEHFTC